MIEMCENERRKAKKSAEDFGRKICTHERWRSESATSPFERRASANRRHALFLLKNSHEKKERVSKNTRQNEPHCHWTSRICSLERTERKSASNARNCVLSRSGSMPSKCARTPAFSLSKGVCVSATASREATLLHTAAMAARSPVWVKGSSQHSLPCSSPPDLPPSRLRYATQGPAMICLFAHMHAHTRLT